MRRPRLLVLSSWVVATALATLVSAAGVSIVTKDVTSDHGPALAAADVVALLAADADAKVAAQPVTTVPEPTTPPPDTTAPAAPEPPPPSSSRPPATAAEPPAIPATFATRGGVISVACTGDSVALLSARPDNDFQVQVHDSGPDVAVVRFASAGTRDGKLAVACPAGTPTLVDERPATPAEPTAARQGRDRHDGYGTGSDHDLDDGHRGGRQREDGERRSGRGRSGNDRAEERRNR